MNSTGSSVRDLHWGALFFGTVSYLCIIQFDPPSSAYNYAVAGYVLAAACVLFVALLCSGEKLTVTQRTGFLLCAMGASAAFSTWGAVDLRSSVDRLMLYYAVALFGLVVYLLHRAGRRGTAVGYLMAIGIVHVAILAVILLWVHEHNLPRRIPYHSNIRHFAYHGYLAAAAATAVFALRRESVAITFPVTVAALFGIVFFGSRGALYSWAVFVGTAIILTDRRKQLLAFSVSALLLAGLAAYQASALGLATQESLFARAEIGASVVYRSAGRWPIWVDTLQAILKQPWFGYGPEGYAVSRCCNPRTIQPHNFVLQFAMEFGIMGFSLLACIAFCLFKEVGGLRSIVRKARTDPQVAVLISILIGFLAYAMVDGLLYHAIPSLHFAVLAALLFATLHPAKTACSTAARELARSDNDT